MKRSHQRITIPVTINGGGTTAIDERRTANIVKEAAQQAVAIYKRPLLSEMVARVKREVEEATAARGAPKTDWDPVVELAMIASNATGNVPMEYQLFALDRVRKYWYAELKEADPTGETPEGQKARAEWAQKLGAVLTEYEKRFRDGVTTVEPQIIEPERKKT